MRSKTSRPPATLQPVKGLEVHQRVALYKEYGCTTSARQKSLAIFRSLSAAEVASFHCPRRIASGTKYQRLASSPKLTKLPTSGVGPGTTFATATYTSIAIPVASGTSAIVTRIDPISCICSASWPPKARRWTAAGAMSSNFKREPFPANS
jgi:hypothetical protein